MVVSVDNFSYVKFCIIYQFQGLKLISLLPGREEGVEKTPVACEMRRERLSDKETIGVPLSSSDSYKISLQKKSSAFMHCTNLRSESSLLSDGFANCTCLFCYL